MSSEFLARRALLLLAPGAVALAGCEANVNVGEAAIAGQRPSGTVEFQEVQAAYIGAGGGGSGTLHFHGRRHPFSIAAAGVGGVGLSTLDAYGEIYNLRELSQFPGTYAQARTGFAIGTRGSGQLWLQNEAGVIMHLRTRRQGLMLSMGADAVMITLR